MESSFSEGFYIFDFMGYPYSWIYVSTNVLQIKVSSYIVMQQTNFPWIYFPTKQQNFGNRQTLAPTI